MAKKFNAQDAKAQRLERLSVIDQEIKNAHDKARSYWTGSGFTNYDEYSRWAKIERDLEREKRSLDILVLDKCYISQHLYSDVHAYEVIGEKSAKCLLIRRLDTKLTDESSKKLHDSFIPGGFCGHFDNSLQEWEYSSNESNEIIEVRLHNDGNYYVAGSRCCPFILHAEPYEHYDYNF